jgi:nucleoside-diphosphate-sugar epimerase
MHSTQRILLCGHTSFAAQGLSRKLEQGGHEVVCFGRGPIARNGQTVTGPVSKLDENPHLDQPFDTLVNFLLLKDADVAANVEFIEALARFCRVRRVKHLVHVSSISVYSSSWRAFRENSRVEENPAKKGAYGALKVATDAWLRAHPIEGTKITLLRPGFIMGEGLVDPIIGVGARLPTNKVLCLGNSRCEMPVFSRELLADVVLKVVGRIQEPSPEIFLLTNPNSPTRARYLATCCGEIGVGRGVLRVPVLLWRIAGIGGELFTRLIGQKQMKVYQKIGSICRGARFDSSETQRTLDLDFGFDWRQKLRASMDGQLPLDSKQQPDGACVDRAGPIVFLGCGRIVKTRHLPSLPKLPYRGDVDFYDVSRYTDSGQQVQSILDTPLPAAGAYVIATPGPKHIEAIDQLKPTRGPVLVEKPLAYSRDELQRWEQLARQREDPIFVCHNYRFKTNVLTMQRHLAKFNPGRLLSVNVLFQSPPVTNETAVWARKERQARTLLMDYGLHFLDVACMFSCEPWQVKFAEHHCNRLGQTDAIRGAVSSPDYSVTFELRQGFMPRKARVEFVFQNYNTILNFFPDTFLAQMSPESFGHHYRAGWENLKATGVKIWEKLSNRLQDDSHAEVLRILMDSRPGVGSQIRIDALSNFYHMLFDIGQRVYGSEPN